MKYSVLFELYGKRMKTEIEAKSPEDAEYQIRGKVKFHQITPVPSAVDDLKKFFGMD